MLNTVAILLQLSCLSDPGKDGAGESAKELFTFEAHSTEIRACAYSADGKYLATAAWNSDPKVWSVRERKALWAYKRPNNEQGSIFKLVFSPNGTYLAACGVFDKAYVWDVESQKLIATLPAPFRRLSSTSALAFSPDGSLLAVGGTIWKTDTWETKETLTPIIDPRWIAFRPDGKSLIATIPVGGSNPISQIHEWNLSSPPTSRVLTTDRIQTYLFALSPDGNRIAYCETPLHKYTVIDSHSGKLVHSAELDMRSILTAAFSPDGTMLVIGGQFSKPYQANDKKWGTGAFVFDCKEWQLLTTLVGHTGMVSSAVFSKDGTLATSCLHGKVKLWDLSGLKPAQARDGK